MKKIILPGLLLVTLLLVKLNSSAQIAKVFTGTITYSIAYPPNTAPNIAAQLPKTITMYIAGNRAKAGATFGPMKQTFIKNADAMTISTLVEREGRKVVMTKSKAQIVSELAATKAPSTQVQTETKKIAGYTCKSAEVNYMDKRGQAHKTTVFYSDELGTNNVNFDNQYRGIKGIPLEMELVLHGIPMKLIASSVSKERVSNKEFETPKDFEVITEQQYKELMSKFRDSK
jgi:GLPGLI family protein